MTRSTTAFNSHNVDDERVRTQGAPRSSVDDLRALLGRAAEVDEADTTGAKVKFGICWARSRR